MHSRIYSLTRCVGSCFSRHQNKNKQTKKSARPPARGGGEDNHLLICSGAICIHSLLRQTWSRALEDPGFYCRMSQHWPPLVRANVK